MGDNGGKHPEKAWCMGDNGGRRYSSLVVAHMCVWAIKGGKYPEQVWCTGDNGGKHSSLVVASICVWAIMEENTRSRPGAYWEWMAVPVLTHQVVFQLSRTWKS